MRRDRRRRARPMRVAVLVDEIAELDGLDSDDLAPSQSTDHILATLENLGYDPVPVSLKAGDARDWLRRLLDGDFDLAFNLCETVAGFADGEYRAAAAVELIGLPMTGASAATLLHCLRKDRCSAILRASGVPVPEWRLVRRDDPMPDWRLFPAIAKPAADDASNGIHAESVAHDNKSLHRAIRRLHATWSDVLVQEFVAGREINLGIVSRNLLPPAEIDFSTLPDGAPPIVSFDAKWRPDTPDFRGTLPLCPAPLTTKETERLQSLAATAWTLMSGCGYARIDVRLSERGRPYVIDVNPNPDLSLDAGLARQARVAGWSYEDLIAEIVGEAVARNGPKAAEEAGWAVLQPEAAAEALAQ